MRRKTNIVAGIDVGTGSITTVVGRIDEAGLEVLGVGRVASKGLRKGVVIHVESTIAAIKDSVHEAEKMSGIKITSATVSISGAHIRGINSSGMTPIKGREITHQDVIRVIEAAQAVPLPTDYETLHILPQEFIVDGQAGIKDPVGISGVRLEARVHLVVVSSLSTQNILKCVNRAGVSVDDIVASGLASARAVLTAEEQEIGACVVDIGGGTTDVCVIQGGGVRLVEVLPIGGNHLTNDIAAGLRTPFASAETIKAQSGIALYSEVGRNDTVEVSSPGDHEPRVLSRSVLAEIIEPRMLELFTLVLRTLEEGGEDKLIKSGIVLTGGQSELQGIVRAAEKVFHLPVRIGRAQASRGVTDLVSKPQYSTAIGLLLSKGFAQPFSRSSTASSGVFRKIGGWFSSQF
jgi:cell division protein FtsA